VALSQKVFLRSFGGSALEGTLCPTPNPQEARGLPPSAGDAPHAANTTQGAAGTPENHSGNTTNGPADFLLGAWISDPLSADFTISGTVTFNFWMLENNMSANVGAKGVVKRVAASTGALSTIVSSAKGTELGFSGSTTVQNWTAAPSSTPMTKGDRIWIEVRYTDVGTMATGFSCRVDYDTAAGTAGDSWVQFTENLTFATAAASGTVIYPTDAASDISTSDDDRLADFARGSGSVIASVVTGNGPISPIQLQRSGTNVRWYTPQLSTTTLQGPIALNLRAYSSSAGVNSSVAVKVIKRTAGGTETDLAYGLLCWGGTLAATDTTVNAGAGDGFILGCADTRLADGDRLGILVYTDDACTNNCSTATTRLSYSGTSASAAGDTWLQFNSTLTEFTGGAAAQVPYVSPMAQLIAQ
jgi:hypothetical protein